VLAGWIVEKLREWSDCNGDIEKRRARDEISTLLTNYWATGTIGQDTPVSESRVRFLFSGAHLRVAIP
jgi:hypothetical protein